MFCSVSGKIAKCSTLTPLIRVFNYWLKINLYFSSRSRIDSNGNTILFVFQKLSIAEVWMDYKSLPRASPQCFLPPLVTLHSSSEFSHCRDRKKGHDLGISQWFKEMQPQEVHACIPQRAPSLNPTSFNPSASYGKLFHLCGATWTQVK